MLWQAGQARVGRESRDRLTELYVGMRDGYVAAQVATGRATPRGDSHIPAYARSSGPPQSPEAHQATLARLGAMFPGAVTRKLS